MKKLFFLTLMMIALTIASQTIIAQSTAYTPEKGSPERKAILDAVRKYRKAPSEVYSPTAFSALKGWAYVSARDPNDPDVDTEAFEVILRRSGKTWKVVDEISHVEGSDYNKEVKRIRKRFHAIPAAIFPQS